MIYFVGENKYILSYQALREDFYKYSQMSDVDFFDNIPSILHFACIVCYLKEIPNHAVLIDNGIIHELVHLLNKDTKEDALLRLAHIRETFNQICILA